MLVPYEALIFIITSCLDVIDEFNRVPTLLWLSAILTSWRIQGTALFKMSPLLFVRLLISGGLFPYLGAENP